MPDTRTVRITETTNVGLPTSYKWSRKALRVVECRESQRGHKSERGVIVHYETDHFNGNARGPRSKYRVLRAACEAVRERLLRELQGVDDMPRAILADYLQEIGA